MGFYIDTGAAKGELGRDFDCLPPVSLEHNQALAESEYCSRVALPKLFIFGTMLIFAAPSISGYSAKGIGGAPLGNTLII